MRTTRDGRLLTGAYGTWRGERHTLLGPQPDGGKLRLLRWSADPLPSPWKSARLGGESPIRFRNQLSVEFPEVSEIFTVQVEGMWRQCGVIIDSEPDDERWNVQFASARDAWAHHAQDQPGIDGDPYDRVGERCRKVTSKPLFLSFNVMKTRRWRAVRKSDGSTVRALERDLMPG